MPEKKPPERPHSRSPKRAPVSPDVVRANPDPRHIRALAHPLRLQILDLLGEHGQLTATQVSDLVGESPANCAFHLRTLAHYGYIEEAGGGKGRERPWKEINGYQFLDPVDADDETVSAINAAQAARRQREQARWQAWTAREPTAPLAWRKAAFEARFDTWLTPAELEQVSEVVGVAIMQIIENRSSVRAPEAARVQLSVSGFPFGSNLGPDDGAKGGTA
jgi:DNA-binding transcriptional ArsR family regulator